MPTLTRKPDAATQRRRDLQKELSREPELRAELQELSAARDDLQARIDRGELTPRAMGDVCRRINHIRSRLSAIGSPIRRELVNSAPEDLRCEFGIALERKKSALARRESARREFEKIENVYNDRSKYYRDVCSRQEGKAIRWTDADHAKLQREIAALKRERDTAHAEAEEAERRFSRAVEQLEELRERCIFA